MQKMNKPTNKGCIYGFVASICAFALLPDLAAEKPLVRFGLVTDVHYGDIPPCDLRKSWPPADFVNYRDGLAKMRRVTAIMNADRPDFLIELGDFKDDSKDLAKTVECLDRIEKAFAAFEGPRYHALGNHDTDVLAKDEFLAHVANSGFEKALPYYAFGLNGVTFIVLDANYDSDLKPYCRNNKWWDANIPPEELRWLEAELAKAKGHVVVFCHQRLDPDAWEKHEVRNASIVRGILERSGKVCAVFTGHEHIGGICTLNGIVYYSLRSCGIRPEAEAAACAVATLDASGCITVKGYGGAASFDGVIPAVVPKESLPGIPDAFAETKRTPGDTRVPFADPQVFVEDGVYYLYGTHARHGVAVATSTDGRSWRLGVGKSRDGLALHRDDSFGDIHFWAPECHRVGEKYYLLYTSEIHVCIAEGDSPLGPFRQIGGRKPLLDGKTLDNSLFVDGGRKYMVYSKMGDAGHGERIHLVELADDLRSVKPGTDRMILSVSEPWEMVKGTIAEGPFVVKEKGLYWLLYSANGCDSHDYAVGFATAEKVEGPWIKGAGNPFIRRLSGSVGCGHGAPYRDPQGRWHYVFHAHHDAKTFGPRTAHSVLIAFEVKGGVPRISVAGTPVDLRVAGE